MLLKQVVNVLCIAVHGNLVINEEENSYLTELDQQIRNCRALPCTDRGMIDER